MDTKLTLINFIDIILRVPSLFMLDEAFQSNLADLGLYPSSLLPLHKEADFDYVTGGVNHTLLKPHHSINNYDSNVFGNLRQSHKNVIEHGFSISALSYFDSVIYGSVLGQLVQILLLMLGTGFSLFTLTLWTKHLVRLYEFLFSMLLIVVSYHCNSQMYNSSTPTNASILNMVVELNLDGLFQVIPYLFYALCNMATQSILASGYLFITLGPPVASIQGLLALSFVVPSFAVMLPFQNDSIPFWGIILPSLHVVGVAIYHLPKVYQEVKDRIDFVVATIRIEGLVAFVETEWLRLNIPMVFRTFWVFRCALHFFIFLSSSSSLEWDQETIQTLLKILLVRGCETLPSILGMAAIFSWITNKTYTLCQRFLLMPNDEGSSHVGPVSAVLFIILAFQNGLSALKPAARIVRLLRNVFLLIACFLHFIHNAVDPVLMSLAASANPDIGRHFRALFVCGILTLVTASGLTFLWSYHYMSTWLLAVTGFSVEVISKVFISLALYGLFLADAKFNEFWDQLDDHVYRVRCFGRAVEFLVGLFLLCNSAFILIFESGGAIRAVLVALHAYFNLWCEARAGWRTFSRRRTAVYKISTLQTVTCPEELDDVCAICFHELKPSSGSYQATVKVTPCRHYFHAVCLRKWLYVQDRCPMCHSTLWPQSQLQATETPDEDDPHQE